MRLAGTKRSQSGHLLTLWAERFETRECPRVRRAASRNTANLGLRFSLVAAGPRMSRTSVVVFLFVGDQQQYRGSIGRSREKGGLLCRGPALV